MALQPGDRVEFSFWEAGCLIWVGSLDAYDSFHQAWADWDGNTVSSDLNKIRQLILEEQAVMPMGLYQDDGYVTRVVLGELDEREAADWTARASWQLTLPSGKLVVSGVVDEEASVPSLADADPQDLLQCYVEVTPGQYAVTVYAYPPGDLSTGWGQIDKNGLWPPSAGIEAEDLFSYFQRTRPGEVMPDWLGEEYAATAAERQRYGEAYRNGPGYVNFVVQLLPLTVAQPAPTLEEDGCLKWEFRKPERFPLGLVAHFGEDEG